MRYYYLEKYGQHWVDIMAMLEMNYCQNLDKDTSVIIGACAQYSVEELKKTEGLKNRNIIVYQLEPLLEHHWHPSKKIIDNLRGADEVWDYDLDNIEVLKKHGIEAKYRPFLYTDFLKRIETVDDPDIDILFYGNLLPRRAKIINDAIYSSVYPLDRQDLILNASIVCLNHVWGSKLDQYIARSKIILNLNPYDADNRQQQSRIFYPLINNKCIISEKANKNYFGDLIAEFSSPQELLWLIGHMLSDDNWKKYSKNNFSGYSSTVRNFLVEK